MPREIPLTRGYVALVDDEDFGWLSQKKWHVSHPDGLTPYAGRSTYREGGGMTPMLMHREILGAVSGQLVDHIDGNGLNNQRANLRLATGAQNMANRRVILSASGFKGVYAHGGRSWRAMISSNGKKYLFGPFDSPRDAAVAYDRAALELHGEFACTNAMLGKL